jgi:hypothetical protein
MGVAVPFMETPLYSSSLLLTPSPLGFTLQRGCARFVEQGTIISLHHEHAASVSIEHFYARAFCGNREASSKHLRKAVFSFAQELKPNPFGTFLGLAR